MIELIVLVVTGLVAGLFGGMLGIGGGVVVMPVLRFLAGMEPGAAAGTTALAVACTTLAGGVRHYRFGHVPLQDIWPIMLSGAGSAALCSRVFPAMMRHAGWLDIGVGVVFGIVALRMVWESVCGLADGVSGGSMPAGMHGSIMAKVSVGAVTGALPGLFGIGTGSVLVPSLRLLFGAPAKTAMGAALACFCLNAWISAGYKYMQGYVQLDTAVPVCVGCILGAQAGAVLNHRSPARLLLGVFGVVFLFTAARFVAGGLRVMGGV